MRPRYDDDCDYRPVRAGDAVKAGCFGAAGVLLFFSLVGLAGFLFLCLMCAGMGSR